MFYKYFMVTILYVHLAISCFLYIIKDSVFKKIYSTPNKMNYIWDKKSRLALLVDSFIKEDEYAAIYDEIKVLINGGDLNSNPAKTGVSS